MLTQDQMKERVFRFIGTDVDKGLLVAERIYQAARKAEIRSFGPFGNRQRCWDLYDLQRRTIEYTSKLMPSIE